MPRHNQPVRYDDIEHTPASTLMELGSPELTNLIQQAERRIEKAQAVKSWLTWIKKEQYLKRISAKTQQGGAV